MTFDGRIEIDLALDAAADEGYPTERAFDALAELMAANEALREALEEIATQDDRGPVTLRDARVMARVALDVLGSSRA